MENNKDKGIKLLPYLSCLFVGCFLFPFVLDGQSIEYKKDSLQAEQYLQIAQEWKEQVELDSAFFYQQKAAKLFSKIELWEKWYDCHYKIYIGLLYQGKYEATIEYLEYSIDSIILRISDPYYLAKTNGWLGTTYYYEGNYNLALKHYLEESRLLKEMENSRSAVPNFANMGLIYFMKGDFKIAIPYLEKAEKIYLEQGNKDFLALVYFNLGKAYSASKEYDQAIQTLQKSMEYIETHSDVYSSLCEVYIEKEEYGKALYFAEKTLVSLKKENRNLGAAEALYARIYEFDQKYELAGTYYGKALNSFQKDSTIEDRKLGKFHIEMGDNFSNKDMLSKSLESYQKALHKLLPYFSETKPESNPSFEKMDLANSVWVFMALSGKGIVFEKKYKENGDLKYLEKAMDCFEASFECVDFLRSHQSANESKTDLIYYAYPIYEKAIAICSQLKASKGTEDYVDKAFSISQKTKSFLLSSTLQNFTALEQGGIPEDVIEEEAELKQSILERDLKISKLDREDGNENTITKLKEEQFKSINELENLKDILEQKYPQYYKLKYENKMASIGEVRNQRLDQETAIIDYFFGDSSIYILGVSKDKSDFRMIRRTPKLDEAINRYNYESGNADYLNNSVVAFERFTQSSYFLYEILLEKTLESLGSKIERLVIIPDGILNKVSFDALLMEEVLDLKPNYSSTNLSYLIEKYVISYHYSPQILLKELDNNKSNKAPELFAGFAPEFKGNKMLAQRRVCSEDGLSSLEYNREEVIGISNLFGGKTFLGPNATVSNFKQQASDFRILHFATHACMSEGDALKHRIYFSNKEYLSTYELFNLPLKSEMVVLSSCESGLGEVVKGEGVMSLARGFSYAGCPSVIMSLWSVSDKASSDIMQAFYKQIDQGFDKDESLRNAKLEYLSSNKSFHHHPYFWAAFVPVGDIKAIDLNKAWPLGYWIILGSVCLILGFVFFWNKRQRV